MDGTNRTLLYQTTTSSIWGLAIDYSNEVLYWTNRNILERSNLDGSNRRTIAFLNDAFLLDVMFYEGSLYFTDDDKGISSIKLSNTSQITTHTASINFCADHVLHGLQVINDQLQIQSITYVVHIFLLIQQPIYLFCSGFNPCGTNNGRCSELCLLSSTDSRGYSCACQDGKVLHENGLECVVGMS